MQNVSVGRSVGLPVPSYRTIHNIPFGFYATLGLRVRQAPISTQTPSQFVTNKRHAAKRGSWWPPFIKG